MEARGYMFETKEKEPERIDPEPKESMSVRGGKYKLPTDIMRPADLAQKKKNKRKMQAQSRQKNRK